MVTLLPRLIAPVADYMLKDFLSHGIESWKGFDSRNLPDPVRFAATGGSRASEAQLTELRSNIERIARDKGFGEEKAKRRVGHFDADIAIWLAGNPIFASGEALRDDVWAFVGVSLAPDIVHWRFGPTQNRYLGGVRNTFQRLWMRAKALDRGPGAADQWQLIRELSEDAHVQIQERPSIGADPVLARAIAEAWLRAAGRHGKERMEPIMRGAALRIRIQNETRNLSGLPRSELEAVLDGLFDNAARGQDTP